MKKSLKAAFCIGLFSLCLSTHAVAQYREAPNALTFRAMAPNYRLPITGSLRSQDFTFGGEFQYIRHLTSFLNIGFPVKFSEAKVFRSGDRDMQERIYALSLDGLLHVKLFKENYFIYPYLFGGFGAVYEDFQEITFAVPAGVSINFRLASHWYLSTQGEYRFGMQDNRDNLQLSAGLLVILGKKSDPLAQDQDGDGVRDLVDQCPTVAGTAATDGCPDRDLDGIQDDFDRCPDLPGTATFLGCPDSDGDGIMDSEDSCPNEAGLFANQGCPNRDSDMDGILDENDPCPTEAGTLNGCPDRDFDQVADNEDQCPDEFGPVATNGCPDFDRDGFSDLEDACPQQAAPGSTDGCPVISQEVVERLNYVARAVKFETGSAVLTRASYENMSEIYAILVEYGNYHMRIEGHTDSSGSDAVNLSLSEKRASACYQYFLNRGIDPSRLSFRGYGEANPIASNANSAGREQNRRVEFKLFLPDGN